MHFGVCEDIQFLRLPVFNFDAFGLFVKGLPLFVRQRCFHTVILPKNNSVATENAIRTVRILRELSPFEVDGGKVRNLWTAPLPPDVWLSSALPRNSSECAMGIDDLFATTYPQHAVWR